MQQRRTDDTYYHRNDMISRYVRTPAIRWYNTVRHIIIMSEDCRSVDTNHRFTGVP
jgi:hypothetical protein